MGLAFTNAVDRIRVFADVAARLDARTSRREI